MIIANEVDISSNFMTVFPPVKSILVIAPHPDDEVFGCGGTVSLLQKQGSVVRIIVVTDGALGGNNADRSLIETRAEESCAAATILGLDEPTFWGLPDRGLKYGEVLIERIKQSITKVHADLVFLPSPTDWHPDHQAIAFAGAEAIRRLGGRRQVAFYEVTDALPSPNLVFDISSVTEDKLRAMRCFQTQLQDQPYDTRVSGFNSFRAFHLGAQVTNAEAFTLLSATDLAKGLPVLIDGPMACRRIFGFAATGSDIPLVSVIIRSMDRPTLIDALDSLALQTYSNIEVVVVNATGSKHQIIDRYLGRFPINLIGSDNERIPRSRAANLGLDAAQGEFLLFLDDDDWLEPTHIHSLVLTLSGQSEAVAAYAGVRCVKLDTNGVNIETVRLYNDDYDPVRLLVENFIPIHALVFRRVALEQQGRCRFDESMDLYEDWDFWLQLQLRGDFVHHPEITAFYRIHPGGGEGIQADQDKSVAALDQLLAKWRIRWTPEQLRRIVARTRLLAKLLADQSELIDQQSQELTELHAAIVSHETSSQALNHHVAQLNERITLLDTALRKSGEDLSALSAQNHSLRLATSELKAHCTKTGSTLAGQTHRTIQYMKTRISFAAALLRQGQYKDLVWRLLLKLYTSRVARHPIRWIPYDLKRQVRNYFTRGLAASEAPEFSGKLSDNPLVSIVIPAYQHSDYLEQCIRSALDQTYDHLEVIVVDDASPDLRVQEILQSLSTHARLHLHRNPTNLGIAATQNLALLSSRGEIIAFLDCDDFLGPDAVKTSLQYWKDDTVYSHTARININEANQEINRICFQHLPRSDYFAENLEAMYATHFKMIRRDVFARLGLFDPRFDTAQDYDYLMRVAAHYPSTSFAYVPHFVYNHRLHPNQTTETANSRQANAIAIIQHEATLRRDIQKGCFDKMLSFIMLSFGKHSQTLEAIKSIENTVQVPHEIILFDNGSDAETVEFIKQYIEGKFKTVHVIYNDLNLGPAAGRREALRRARGDWFIVFDNDEVAEPGWLEELLVRASSDSNIGAVTCKVIFPNQELQCCGGYTEQAEEDIIELKLISRGVNAYALESAEFRDCDWCPIGATLFTQNPAEYLHAGYPNVFEDAGVSMALRRQGFRLVNSPASWVRHEHVTFRKSVEMGERYNKERYDPKRMLISVASFYRENGLIIHDEYVWRENQLDRSNLPGLRTLLEQTAQASYPSKVPERSGDPQ